MEYNIHELSNGLRIVFRPVNSLIAHVGLFINVGSRDEEDHEYGIAHLIEHVMFKGTKKRKAHHILSHMENVGGDINAYTTKEETCIHATFLKEYLDRALELISDIVFQATYPQKEIEKEKSVILDEILSFKDNPTDYIFEDFDNLLFPNSSLGKSILGSTESIQKFKTEDILNFIKKNYSTKKMVLSIVGKFEFKTIVSKAEKYFNQTIFSSTQNNSLRNLPINKNSFKIEEIKNLNQAHCIIGTEAYSFYHPNRTALLLMNNILGGPGMNSRLNISLRERHGYTYNIESGYLSFTDIGIFTVYFGCHHSRLNKSIELSLKEFDKLKKNLLSDLQLHRAKKQFIGQLAISADNYENLMLAMGKSILVYNKYDDIADVQNKLEKINAKNLLEVANEILDSNKLSILIYK